MSSASPSASTSTSPSPGSLKEPKDISSPSSSPKDTEETTPAQESPEEPSKSTEELSEKDTENLELPGTTPPAPAASSTPWQAIFSPQYNAYYFFNPETNETTWENPLVQAAESSTPAATASSSSVTPSAEEASASLSAYNALQAAAMAQGIDPSLAYLDPSLAGPVPGSSSGAYGAAAKFNARTGQFTRVDARDPSHLSEYERAKRMSEFYFDVNAWESERAQEQEEAAVEGNDKKRKRPSKKDLVCFAAPTKF